MCNELCSVCDLLDVFVWCRDFYVFDACVIVLCGVVCDVFYVCL